MRVWRLCKAASAAVLDGRGNRATGARWNSPGRGVLYTVENPSLTVLELLVHTELSLLPRDLVLLTLDLPESVPMLDIQLQRFPKDWRAHPDWFRQTGDRWLREGTALALRAPSVVVPQDRNIMVNPAHPMAAAVRVVETTPFTFDARLIS